MASSIEPTPTPTTAAAAAAAEATAATDRPTNYFTAPGFPRAAISQGPLVGEYVTVVPFERRHVDNLWHTFGFDVGDFGVWKYLPAAAPKTPEEFWQGFTEESSSALINFAVLADPARLGPGGSVAKGTHSEVLGLLVYGDISEANRTLELGLFFAPSMQRTTAATEALFLVFCNVMDPRPTGTDAVADAASTTTTPPPPPPLPYRRITWKTSSFNTRSQRAAARLGFIQEAVIRNHMLVLGRSRDSIMLSLIDDDWPLARAAMAAWLAPGNFDEKQGQQIRSLDRCRAEIARARGL